VPDPPVVDAPPAHETLGDERVDVGHDPRDVGLVQVVADHERVEAVEPRALQALDELSAERLVRPVPQPELAAQHDRAPIDPALAQGLAEEDVGAGVLGVRTHVVVRDVEEPCLELDGTADHRHGVVGIHPVPGVPGSQRERGDDEPAEGAVRKCRR